MSTFTGWPVSFVMKAASAVLVIFFWFSTMALGQSWGTTLTSDQGQMDVFNGREALFIACSPNSVSFYVDVGTSPTRPILGATHIRLSNDVSNESLGGLVGDSFTSTQGTIRIPPLLYETDLSLIELVSAARASIFVEFSGSEGGTQTIEFSARGSTAAARATAPVCNSVLQQAANRLPEGYDSVDEWVRTKNAIRENSALHGAIQNGNPARKELVISAIAESALEPWIREAFFTLAQGRRYFDNGVALKGEDYGKVFFDPDVDAAFELLGSAIEFHGPRPDLSYLMGTLFLFRTYGIEDYEGAFVHLDRAAKAGNARGAYWAARLLADGELSFRDDKRAEAYFQLASEGGISNAGLFLGDLLASEDASDEQLSRAIGAYDQAVQSGNADAAQRIADVLKRRPGEGVVAMAAQSLNAAAREGNAPVQAQLAEAYFLGLFEGASPQRAFAWHWIAAANGHKPSELRLSVMSSNLSDTDRDEFREKAQLCLESQYRRCGGL